MKRIGELLRPELVTELRARDKQGAMSELVDLLARAPEVCDAEALRRAVLERERLTTTGIGLGTAIPHAKIRQVTDFAVAVGRSREGIDFDSLDGQPVHLVFLACASDRQAIEFVRLLAQIVNLVRDEGVRQSLIDAETPADLLAALRTAEDGADAARP